MINTTQRGAGFQNTDTEPISATIQNPTGQMEVDYMDENNSTGHRKANAQSQHQSRPLNPDEETKEEFKSQSVSRIANAANRESRDSRDFLDTMITNRVYNYSFNKEMTERLDFLRFLVAFSPDTMLKPQ